MNTEIPAFRRGLSHLVNSFLFRQYIRLPQPCLATREVSPSDPEYRRFAGVRPQRGYYRSRRVLLWAAIPFMAICAVAKGAGQKASFSWSPSATPGVMGYALYCGTNTGNYPVRIDVGTNTTVTLTGLKEGRTNFYAVAAYDTNRIEGVRGSEIVYLVPGMMKPLGKSSPGSPMRLQFSGAIGQTYDIQASTDLRTWSTISTMANLSSNAWVTYQDPQSTVFPKRFYRLVLH
jgi:hypothetical protein